MHIFIHGVYDLHLSIEVGLLETSAFIIVLCTRFCGIGLQIDILFNLFLGFGK